MGLISLTLPNDGETIDAADVNSPLNTIATAINGNLDNANIKTGAAIDGSKIASASLTATQMADSVSPVKRWDEGMYDFVASGLIWTGDSYGSTRVASMTAGVVYINGERVTVSAVTARTFTASKDTYVDVSSTGALSYTEVANNAASPSLAANSIRIAIIVTGASSIADANSINFGRTLNNRNPLGRDFLLVAYGSINSSGTTSEVDGSAPSIKFSSADIPADGKIYVIAYADAMYMAGTGSVTIRPRLGDNSAITSNTDGSTSANSAVYGQVITRGVHDVTANTNVTIKIRGIASNTNAWQSGTIALYCTYVRNF